MRPRIRNATLITWALVAMAAGAFVMGMGGSGGKSSLEAGTSATEMPPPSMPQPSMPQGSALLPLSPPPPPPAPPPLFFGVSTPSGPHKLAELDAFVAAAGRQPHVLMFSQDWASGDLPRELLDRVVKRGMTPIITWEPRDHRLEGQGAELPGYKLSRIIDGSWDDHIRRWARAVGALGYPVGLRFAQQMNGSWFPWSEGVNGNEPGEYVAAWRHVRRIFAEEQVTKVTWIWSPNISYTGSAPLRGLYPGDEYVDWIGVDGYNGGSELPWGGWRSPQEMYGPTIREMAAFTSKPVMLTEVGSTEGGGSKADWISELFLTVERERLIGFIWVEAKREADWRIVSSPAAQAAFAAGVSRPRFTAMSPELLPVRR